MMKLQLPEGLEDEMHVMLLDKLLGAKFFEILRTQYFGFEKMEGLEAEVVLGLFLYIDMFVLIRWTSRHVLCWIQAFVDPAPGFATEAWESWWSGFQ